MRQGIGIFSLKCYWSHYFILGPLAMVNYCIHQDECLVVHCSAKSCILFLEYLCGRCHQRFVTFVTKVGLEKLLVCTVAQAALEIVVHFFVKSAPAAALVARSWA